MDEQPPRVTGEGQQIPSLDPNATPGATEGRRRQGGPPRRTLSPKAQPNPWLVGMAIATVLAAVSVIAFGLFSSNTIATATDETTSTTAATGDPGAGDGTTDGTTDGSTDGATDGTTDATEATLPGGDAPPIGAVGDPIPIGELTMSSDDIGPLDFGDAGNEVLGRLVSTFGQPTDDTGFIVGNGSFGECPGDSIRVVRWGPLNIITRGESANHVFVSYRMDLRYGGITSPTTDMMTVSGLRVGDTVGQLEATYGDFNIEFIVDQDVGMTFELRASATGNLLLWGPVDSNAADALVTGIYSPDACSPDAGGA